MMNTLRETTTSLPMPLTTGLAIFDLDDTLLDGDATGLWTDWQIQQGWIKDGDEYRAIWTRQMEDYMAGNLDMEDHLEHLLSPLIGRNVAAVTAEVEYFIEAELIPRLFSEGLERIAWHQAQGHQVVIISASTAQLVAPLAKRLGVDAALATALEIDKDCYTGQATGIRTFRDGKLDALKAWQAEQQPAQTDMRMQPCWGYSDSRNDLPLLEFVDHPYAVRPDPCLAAIAHERDWQTLHWQSRAR
ncbi:HAD family hydrolase [Cobetia crustatorum]|uniref:HAD family hydrolase n=1 Tax=Cobetia crustatorum TaxID=553385 RepID=UPI000A03127E|nr:HAD-IB family hydrolase [Cobetia crustatorum]